MVYTFNDIIYNNILFPDDGIKYHQVDTYNYIDIQNTIYYNSYDSSYNPIYLNTEGVLFDENKIYDSYNFINKTSETLLDSYYYSYDYYNEYDIHIPDFLTQTTYDYTYDYNAHIYRFSYDLNDYVKIDKNYTYDHTCAYDEHSYYKYNKNEFNNFFVDANNSIETIGRIYLTEQYNYNANIAKSSTNCIINGIDIDWNDAAISGLNYDTRIIKTTSDLIYVIQQLVNETKILFD